MKMQYIATSENVDALCRALKRFAKEKQHGGQREAVESALEHFDIYELAPVFEMVSTPRKKCGSCPAKRRINRMADGLCLACFEKRRTILDVYSQKSA